MRISFIFFLLIPFCFLSQSNKDSLINIWENSNQNKEKLSAVKKLIWEVYMNTQPDSACYYAGLQYKLAESLGDKSLMAKGLEGQGVSHAQTGNYLKAEHLFEKSLDIFKKLKDQQSVARNLDFIATTYCKMGNYEKAIHFYEKAFELAEIIQDKRRQSSLYGNSAVIYQKQGKLYSAIDYYFKSIKLAKELQKSSKDKYYARLNIANAYHNIANIYNLIGEKEKALEYYFKSVKINEKYNFDKYLIINFLSLADFYLAEPDLDKALYYNNKSLSKAIELNSPIDIIKNESNIALIYYKTGKKEKAQVLIKKCLSSIQNTKDKQLIAEVHFINSKIEQNTNKSILSVQKTFDLAEDIGDVQLQKKASQLLYEKYKKTNQLNKALGMYEVFIEMRDSLYSEEITRLKFKQEYNQKLKEDSIINANKNKLQQAKIREKESVIRHQRVIKYSLIVGFVMIFGIMFLLIRNAINSKKHQKEEYEKLLAQMQFFKSKNILKKADAIISDSEFIINKELINLNTNNKLNETDWKILHLICSTPTMAYKEIGEKVFLSMDGVKSSFKKMYDLLEITASGRNKKLALAIKVIKLSEGDSQNP